MRGNPLEEVEMQLDPQGVFAHYLRSKGRSVTETRKKVVKAVFSLHGHFDASELWAKLKDESIALSTIYRTLHLLAEAGLVREVRLGEPHAHWEHVFGLGEHGHLICLGCGKVIEFSAREIEEALKRVVESHKFQYWKRNLEVFGLCTDCSKEGLSGRK